MKLPRQEQVKFARQLLAIEGGLSDANQLTHLKELVWLLSTPTDNAIPGYLSEYLYETIAIAQGNEDTGWRAEFKKKLDEELEITSPGTISVEIPRAAQIESAKAILAIVKDEAIDVTTLGHLKALTNSFINWFGQGNDIAVNLNGYVGELYAIRENDGTGNAEWKDEYKKRIEEYIADIK